MSPQDFKAARLSLGLSTRQLGHILNVDQRTIRRWEAEASENSREPHPTAVRVMQWMLAGWKPAQWPR